MEFLLEACYFIIISLIKFYKFVESNIYQLFDEEITRTIKKRFLEKDIEIDGNRPWDITVKNPKFYNKIATFGVDGFAESYVDGWWETKDFEQLLMKTLTVTKEKVKPNFNSRLNKLFQYLELDWFNLQTKEKSFEVGEQHYDLGNDLYEAMLGPSMQYTCAYWRRAKNLDEAQTAKMELVAKKLKLKPGMRVLDMGCGWGSLAKYLAENHGVEVVGITIGVEGAKYASEKCASLNLKVDIRVMDYRDMNEKFDRICSIGMMEHVGRKNFRSLFEVVDRCLAPNGIFVCHTIGSNSRKVPSTTKFYNKYIFANARVPYYKEVMDASEDLFVIEDWHNIGYDYAQTLQCWWDKFEEAWPQLQSKYGQKFYRIWQMYIFNSKEIFRSRKYHLWQIAFSKRGVEGGYVYER